MTIPEGTNEITVSVSMNDFETLELGRQFNMSGFNDGQYEEESYQVLVDAAYAFVDEVLADEPGYTHIKITTHFGIRKIEELPYPPE